MNAWNFRKAFNANSRVVGLLYFKIFLNYSKIGSHRSSSPEVFYKKGFFEILQNSQENTYDRVLL